jgi:hydrogenase-4 component B
LLANSEGLYFVFAASMLALTSGLAAACFVKAFGVTFLGGARSTHAAAATEVPVSMIGGMLLLGAAGVLLGVLPGFAMALVDRPTADLLAGPGAVDVVTVHGPLVLSSGATAAGLPGTSISITVVAVLFVALAGAAWLVRARRRAERRVEPTWTCGMTPTARFDYTATAFAKPLRLSTAARSRISPRRTFTTGSSAPPSRSPTPSAGAAPDASTATSASCW